MIGVRVLLASIKQSVIGLLTKGYVAGGAASGSGTGEQDGISRFDFATEQVSATGMSLSVARFWGGGVSSPVTGYILGGYDTANTDVIDSVQFSNETQSLLAAAMSPSRHTGSAVSSLTKGYVGHGADASNTLTNTVVSFTFSTETSAAVSGNVLSVRWGGCGCESDSTGYFIAGSDVAYPLANIYADIGSIQFSSESLQAIAASLPSATNMISGTSSSLNGYISGNNLYSAVIQRITFATETTSNTSASVGASRSSPAPIQSNTSGYYCGGKDSAYNTISSIQSIDFATETSQTISATLIIPVEFATGIQG